MKNKFRGWNTVFNFTFHQATKGLGFKVVTALISLLIIGGFILINVIVAKPGEKGSDSATAADISPISTVYVLDNSGLAPTDFKAYSPELSGDHFKNVTFVDITGQTRDEVIKSAGYDESNAIAVIITATDKGYELEAVIPSGSPITKGDVNDLLGPMQSGFTSSKLVQSGLSQDQLTAAMEPIVTTYANIGEDTSDIVYIIKIAAPMLFGLVLYMMLLLYSQDISKSVSTEKTSKLVDTLLTSIHPYALITGKVLAITTMAVMQFVTWIISGIIGLYGGNAVAHYFYPEYQNSVITIINYLKDNIGETAMTMPAVIMAILIFCIGFLFYCVLAGLAGSLVSKPEEVASTQALFTFPILISWLVCYFAPLAGNQGLMQVARYVPFTIPFCIPVELITGSMSLVHGFVSLLILFAFSLLFIMLSARIYKGMILYNGQKVSLKTIRNVLRAKE